MRQDQMYYYYLSIIIYYHSSYIPTKVVGNMNVEMASDRPGVIYGYSNMPPCVRLRERAYRNERKKEKGEKKFE
jgi:hypothetical protein